MAITIDITKAKEVWKNKIRYKRTGALKKLDVDFVRAQEASSDTSAIVTKKNTLRDLPGDVDSASTIEEIKAVWNTDLLGEKD
tara:strand:- start:49 stop:297 length:249 start_codon:yes stop_codon:yes gene_type:complete